MLLPICLLATLTVGCCYVALRPVSYTILPYDVKRSPKYRMQMGTARRSAYDPRNQILYVVGDKSRLLHVLDVRVPSAPVRLLSYLFSEVEGSPLDVEVCNDNLAVSTSFAKYRTMEGHLRLFHAVDRANPRLQFRDKISVGSMPKTLKFTPNCSKILVANEGPPGLDLYGKYEDPEGTVSVVSIGSSLSVTNIEFTYFNDRNLIRSLMQQGLRYIYRYYHDIHGKPSDNTLSRDLKPTYITISPDGNKAYVGFQANNAIAKIDIEHQRVDHLFAFGWKNWEDKPFDPSNADGGVHLDHLYKVRSFYQPDAIKFVEIGGKGYILTANEGAHTDFTNQLQGFAWSDYQTVSSLVSAQKIDTQAFDAATVAEMKNSRQLGNLYISSIDGYGFSNKIERLYHFGGRGFSLWDADRMSRIYDSGSDIEKQLKRYQYAVFNSECTQVTTQSPESLHDSTSNQMGPEIKALDAGIFNQRMIVIVGSETVGSLHVYRLNGTVPVFQSVHRKGNTADVWASLYAQGTAGDAGISDIKILETNESPTGRPLVYVVSSQSGSVSFYEIYEETKPIPVG